MTRYTLVIALAALLACTSNASAATIHANGYDSCGDGEEACVLTVSFAAAPGETNTVSVSGPGADGGYVVSDSTAPLTAGENCTQLGPGSARCAIAGGNPLSFTAVEVRLGDMDDSLTSIGETIADGGPGDDTLTGSAVGDALVGGPGRDVLRGGGGDDSLQGDEGPSAADDDLLDGGAGSDGVSYYDRASAVTADLATGAAGSPGEHDRLVDVENLVGGQGPNTLTGDDGPNLITAPSASSRDRATIAGGGGDDRILGGPGPDEISGGHGDDTIAGGIGTASDTLRGDEGNDTMSGSEGADRISGGPGDDSIMPRLDWPLQKKRAPGDRISCGDGNDSVDHPYPRALVPRSCESVTVAHAKLDRPRRAGRRAIAIPVAFSKSRAGVPPCAFFITLRSSRTGALLGRSARIRWRKGARATFRVPLTATGLRRLAHGGAPIVVHVDRLLTCRKGPAVHKDGFSFNP